jgi:iron complex outermembrane receptor protein
MRSRFYAGVAFAALIMPAAAFAQSTGTIDAEGTDDVVVTGSRGPTTINGVQVPDTPKARAVITQEFIERQQPGQTILETLNFVPGVSFTNNDPYGSSGGNLRIRGFSGDRVSVTFDGIPLNDSGNYAVYSNQQLDPELIEQANVNFGATDVDSPTASASGGTVNYRSLMPTDDMHAIVAFTHGTFDFNRVFGMINTGTFTKFGTKAWLAASDEKYDQFRGFGTLKKTQYNAKVYQPIGNDGDFVALAGHYNRNRNSSYSNPTIANIRTLLGTSVVPNVFNATTNPTGPSSANPFTLDLSKAQYDQVFDNRDSAVTGPYDQFCRPASSNNGGPGAQNDATNCANSSTTAINPSDTGVMRLNSRFTLSDKLLFTFDGGYSFTRANGGGSAVFSEDGTAEGSTTVGGVTIPGDNTYQGGRLTGAVDINGDGDTLDRVRVYYPSNTRTQRFVAIAGLRYQLNPDNLVRVAYTWDRARHRQTGEASRLDATGVPQDVFGFDGDNDFAVNDPQGNVLTKRDRLSYAILHQVAGEYRGKFFDNRLNLNLGVRAPFFRRNLTNNCYTIQGQSSDAYCTSQTLAQVGANATTAAYGVPYKNRIETYSAVLPNVGFTFNLLDRLSLFASYAKGFSAPKTDNLYSFGAARVSNGVVIEPGTDVKPEKTDSFDAGLRYTSGIFTAQADGWYIYYKDRIVSSSVQDANSPTSFYFVDRNVGAVKSYGFDGLVNIRPVRQLSLYGFFSYIKTEVQDDVTSVANGVTTVTALKGKEVVETPKWTFGGRAQLDVKTVQLGIEAKRTGKRWVTDVNDFQVAGYTMVNADVRVSLSDVGLERTFLQFNATNLLKERYFGSLSTNTAFTNAPRINLGNPRAFTGSIHFEF